MLFYNNSISTFAWTEYGPEVDQSSIENTCAADNNGVNNST